MAKADGEVPVSYFPISIPLVYAPIHAGYESEPDYFGRHKTPPMVPILLSVDEEKSALEVSVRQSCEFTLIIKDACGNVMQEETLAMSESEQTVVPLQSLPAGTYTIAVQIGEVAYVGSLDI